MSAGEGAQILDFPQPGNVAGYRLERLEVLNWGTFHEQVWALDVRGQNALVTGDIGSGKSTLVDAITTLLVPPQRQQYNKAAGAEAKERSARSYVLGYYKKERGDGASSKPVALRDAHSYSVIVARFRNAVLESDVTIGQVMWMATSDGQPERIYVVADRVLTIKDHFADFGSEISGLKKRLKRLGVEIHESFPPYAAAFRRRFGLDNEQALTLFQQTVSMKSVGNLTDFVREHMLEAFPIQERVDALLAHFEALQKAHDAVIRAKDQIAALDPLVEECDRYSLKRALIASLTECRKALPNWIASIKSSLLSERIVELENDQRQAHDEFEHQTALQGDDETSRDGLKLAISAAGGDRIEQIKETIERHAKERDKKLQLANRYMEHAGVLGLGRELTLETFEANRRWIADERPRLDGHESEAQQNYTKASMELQRLREQAFSLAEEIESLQTRKSNIPLRTLNIRERMTRELGLTADELPFAGELIEVDAAATGWEGAVERLLRSFGLSVLVHARNYDRVAAWVDKTDFGERLVYLLVRDVHATSNGSPRSNSLLRKVQVQPQSAFYPWVQNHLARNFDVACCETLDEFRREERAITRMGQIKRGPERHEKDDRFSIHDRSRYVLGWSNERKLAALRNQLQTLDNDIDVQARKADDLNKVLRQFGARRTTLERMADVASFADVDWQGVLGQIAGLKAEREAIESSSNKLRTLQAQLDEIEAKIRDRKATLDAAGEKKTRINIELERARKELRACSSQLARITPDERDVAFPELEKLRPQALGSTHTWALDDCQSDEREFHEWLQEQVDREGKQLGKLAESIVARMGSYCHKYPIETREVGSNLEAADEYRSMRHRLVADDLPRFELRFKQLLNENTIREIAGFQSELRRQRESILERIGSINGSLRSINYNPGRYIALVSEDSPDAEVRDFRRDLKACTENTLGSSEEGYTEEKFLQVKRIIERLRGREGSSDADRKWAKKVTDVRAWFIFSASERYRSDDKEHEFYADSGGKSGGQKEKLAYTVLAASLAYQFGLDAEHPKPRSFRFIVIDEAFGRGSDDSATYALQLFAQLGLQLLIVTPLQKINVIEPHVSSVGFVHNEDGRASKLRNLTIEEYRAERAARGR